ncbi:hypothetical protein [Larkinella terrae]|uniref:hypothetical protein n=1 Tax=Larkinella terrae TaxID=2025311 RepID=UPI001E5278BB|nr:hypothetical protein [Larkinella terrae]
MRYGFLVAWLIIVSNAIALAQPAAKRIATHPTDFAIKALDEQTKAEIPATYRVKAVLSK